MFRHQEFTWQNRRLKNFVSPNQLVIFFYPIPLTNKKKV
ncbi:hypothetical protein BBU94A_N19 (plasmid) [Borreliella burgdorferi 94a]|nr:hypothetical protein BBU72A_J0015 [Borreliella burgdorferi 72a]EEG99414.1 hypothetical protein BBU94A_N19 [Borreliella burgdorferi 94a]